MNGTSFSSSRSALCWPVCTSDWTSVQNCGHAQHWHIFEILWATVCSCEDQLSIEWATTDGDRCSFRLGAELRGCAIVAVNRGQRAAVAMISFEIYCEFEWRIDAEWEFIGTIHSLLINTYSSDFEHRKSVSGNLGRDSNNHLRSIINRVR